MSMRISICTLVKGRREHLVNLVLALRRSRRPPADLVVAVMEAERCRLPRASFPIRQVVLGDEGLPLARARNAAAARAGGELLVFLDADCIAHPAMLDEYDAVAGRGGLLMGDVGYLPRGALEGGVDFARFEALAVRHPERPPPPVERSAPCRDFRAFWSLNFAISARAFARVGGFDERYAGFGGEDVDFARAAMSAGLPLSLVRGAKAYHQQHAQAAPPVRHLDSILANAALFRSKWGMPAMEDWLRAFALMGLVEQLPEGGWRKLREPEERDLALSEMQADEPFASTALVLERLEQQAAGRSGPLRPAA